MAKNTFGSNVSTSDGTGTINTGIEVSLGKTGVLTTEREITSQFVSDGVYKYVYVDTGEDYTP